MSQPKSTAAPKKKAAILTDTVSNKTMDLPIIDGSIGPSVIDVRKL